MKKALVIGFNYRNTANELGGCENDAKQMTMRMIEGGIVTYNIHLETTSMSGAELFAQLEYLRSTQKASDTIYFTMSGHGTQHDGKEGICLFHNGKIEVVWDDDLKKALQRIPGTVVCIFDTCYSGGMERGLAVVGMRRRCVTFDPQTMGVYQPEPNERASHFPVTNRLYYLAACGKDEVAWDTGTAGLFTQALCKGYDRVGQKTRTVAYLTKFALKECAPDQHPNYKTVMGNGTKRIF